MKVHDFLTLLSNCNVNFIYNSNESIICTACVFYSGPGISISFTDLHVDANQLLSLTVNNIYAKGPGLLDIYVS